jgi:hypothetical protein
MKKNKPPLNPLTPMIDVSKYTTDGPGKFESEPPETRYYYERMLEGDGEEILLPDYEEETPIATLFTIDADESAAFDIPHGHIFMLREDSQGFVIGTTHRTREDAEKVFNRWLSY